MDTKKENTKSARLWVVIILLIASALLSYAVPRANYIGTNFISGLKIPFEFPEWKGRDVTSSLNINTEELEFGFISEALGYEYVNGEGNRLFFIILDAGNFHHPKNCFTSAGYEIVELDDTIFNLPGRELKAHTLFTQKGNMSSLSFYWIVIDKNIAHEWIEQKFKQLYFSIINQKMVGLMVRIDIPAKEENIDEAKTLAADFIAKLSRSLEKEPASYILGELSTD